MHILPKGFVRVRHYGILSNTSKAKYIIQIKAQLPEVIRMKPGRPLPEVTIKKNVPVARRRSLIYYDKYIIVQSKANVLDCKQVLV